jgi:hypothetical protein
MGNILSPKMPKPQPVVPLPQEDDEAIRRAKQNEYARLSKKAGIGAVTLTGDKSLGSFGTDELRSGLASTPVLTG